MKILLCKVDMRNKLYEIKFFELCSKKMELMKQIHIFKKESMSQKLRKNA